MRKTVNFLTKAVYVIAGIILLYLTYNSMHYTFLPMFRLDNGNVMEAPDSRLKNLLYILFVFAVIFLLTGILFIKAGSKSQKARRVKIFLVADLILVAATLILYVKNSHIAPYWDQAQVLNSASAFLKGDYSEMANTYLHKFPQQLGLIFWEVPFLAIWDNYGIFQYLNVGFIVLTIYFSYLISKEMFPEPELHFITVVATTLFLPMHVYVGFVYGDLPSIAGSLMIALCITRWCKRNKSKYLIIAVILAVIFTMVRENMLILLLASAIVILLTAVKNRRPAAILAAVLILVLPICANKGVLRYYENKSGVEIDNPIPSVSWIAMGLQGQVEEGTGVGYYNGYNEATWWYQGATTEGAREFVTKDMNERLTYFAENPSYAYSFFRYKILEQWIEPSFDSLYMTVTNYGEAGEWAVKFYEGEYPEKLLDFMNPFLTVAYFFAFIYMIYAFKHEVTPGKLLLIVAFIGGFLFSIIWEAKGRYAMPYFVFTLPIAAAGMGMSIKLVKVLINKFVFKKEVDN